MNSPKTALEIKNLSKTYSNDVRALKGIDLRVERGDFFALLGPNGAGKSTTIGILFSLINKSGGTIEVCGIDIDENFSEAKRLIGIVPQEFNFNVLYGKDTSVDEIISICKKFPLMSKFQLVVIKEAQDLARTIDQLTSYTNNFLDSTILIINYKHKTLDKRKSLYKSIAKNGTVLESKKLYENQVQQWINQQLSEKNIKASNKAVAMIVDYLGSDLNKITNELNKLIQLKKDEKEISDIDIEKYIGISKEYNNFELRKAISEKNRFKAFQIADYFSKNSNSNPLVVTISMVFNFFSKPENLTLITPPRLRFDILTPTPLEMKEGQLIDYSLTILYLIKLHWCTLITDYHQPYKFIDQQIKGPYTLWHHTHTFEEKDGGTLIKDSLKYAIPFGWLGRAIHFIYIKH